MIKKILLAALIVSVGLTSVWATEKANQEQTQEQTAGVAVLDWLKIIDSKEYDVSWNEASGYFKSFIKKEEWANTIAKVRQPLGDVISREFKARQHSTTMPGAPDGEYYTIVFTTVFKNKAAALETVTVMLEKDGKWRLAGYFIK